jgi:hypothetical protein
MEVGERHQVAWLDLLLLGMAGKKAFHIDQRLTAMSSGVIDHCCDSKLVCRRSMVLNWRT